MGATAGQIIAIAKAEVGTKATAVKRCKYNKWFYGSDVSGDCYDWCAVFVCWCFANAGASDLIPVRSAGCGVLATGFNNQGRFTTNSNKFKAGDIVFFHWSNDMSESVKGAYTLDHVGLLLEYKGNGYWLTAEGNTGNSAYGEVMICTRHISCISGVAQPNYSNSNSESEEEEEMIEYGKTNNAVLSFKQHLRVLKNIGVINTSVDTSAGFGDGTLKAVKELQKVAGIEVDGIVGKDTINAVYSLETKAYNLLNTKISNAKKALA